MYRDKLQIGNEAGNLVARCNGRTYFCREAVQEDFGFGYYMFEVVRGRRNAEGINHVFVLIDGNDYRAFGFSRKPEVPCTTAEGKKHMKQEWKPSQMHAPDDVLSEMGMLMFKYDVVLVF